ncbi:MAG TPA: quinone-dependent dihydroorotate dehydrogenase, partial [Chloroflexota bacterium]
MPALYRKLIFPLLTLPEPEASHELALRALARAPIPRRWLAVDDPRLHVSAFGLKFRNPVGLAAGFDKNGIAARGLAALGFGHVEIGTVTPRPQSGRPKPRLFRLKQDQALVNRLGFPSMGADAVDRKLERLARRDFVLGANVGPNAGSVGIEDFVAAARILASHVDYLTVNVSSPNTAGLRDMQQTGLLAELLQALAPLDGPLLVKIAPDLTDEQLAGMLDVILVHNVAGVVATNTTVERPANLRSPGAAETGGLSGRPLRDRSTKVVAFIYRHTGGKLPIVAAGGVATAQDALAKLQAGACLVQLYTGFVYEGPF